MIFQNRIAILMVVAVVAVLTTHLMSDFPISINKMSFHMNTIVFTIHNNTML